MTGPALRILLVSDLHREDLGPGTPERPVQAEFDVLACAGDVLQSDPAGCVDAVANLAGGRPAVIVLGNHDVWDVPLREAVAAARGRNPMVTLLEGDTVEIGGLTFAGGTLWDDPDAWPAGLPRLGGSDPERPLGEPLVVDDEGGPRRATGGDLARLHTLVVEALASARPDVVLTHYPPSEAALARVPGATAWLHGHQHTPLVERRDGHVLVRMPTDRNSGLRGALVEVVPGGRVTSVTPVVERRG